MVDIPIKISISGMFFNSYFGGLPFLWKESENCNLICDECNKEYTVFVDNSMYKAVLDFTRGTIPLYVDYNLRQKPFD